MGLDMSLYRVVKPKHSEDTCYHIIEDGDERPKELCDAIFNVAEICDKTNIYYHMQQIADDFGLTLEELYVSSWGGSDGKTTFTSGETTIELDKDTIDKKYTVIQVDKCLAWDLDEVAYQRKGLNDRGWELIPENCSYTDNYDTISVMVNEGGLSKDFIDNWVDSETVFSPWW